MIWFHDTAEKKDNSELFSPSAYQDIKPTRKMSSEEAISFLDGLFSVAPEGRDVYSIDEESLLAEIFGHFEDEFDFHNPQFSKLEVFRRMWYGCKIKTDLKQ